MARDTDVWYADRDGIAHRYRRLGFARTACGLPGIPQRYAWPTRERCVDCVATLETSALDEALLFRGYGLTREAPIDR